MDADVAGDRAAGGVVGHIARAFDEVAVARRRRVDDARVGDADQARARRRGVDAGVGRVDVAADIDRQGGGGGPGDLGVDAPAEQVVGGAGRADVVVPCDLNLARTRGRQDTGPSPARAGGADVAAVGTDCDRAAAAGRSDDAVRAVADGDPGAAGHLDRAVDAAGVDALHAGAAGDQA